MYRSLLSTLYYFTISVLSMLVCLVLIHASDYLAGELFRIAWLCAYICGLAGMWWFVTAFCHAIGTVQLFLSSRTNPEVRNARSCR